MAANNSRVIFGIGVLILLWLIWKKVGEASARSGGSGGDNFPSGYAGVGAQGACC